MFVEHDHINLIVWFLGYNGWMGVTKRDYWMAGREPECFGILQRKIYNGEIAFTYNRDLAPIERKWCFFV